MVCVLLKPEKSLAMTKEELSKYERTRDPSLLKFKENSTHLTFKVKCLPPSVVASWVEGASNSGVRMIRAFCAGCLAIVLPDGREITPEGKSQPLGFGCETHPEEWFNDAVRMVGMERVGEIAHGIITASSLGEIDAGFLDSVGG